MAGLRLVKTQGSGDYTGKVQSFAYLTGNSEVAAIGDAVILEGTASAAGLASIKRATGTTAHEVTGVIVGFLPDYSNLELSGRSASTARTAYVQVDPNALYELEIGSTLAITDVGANFLLTATAPTTSGSLVRSAMVSGAADADGALRLVRLKTPTVGATLGAVGQTGIFSIIRSSLTNLVGE
jgi:hypothetical protein